MQSQADRIEASALYPKWGRWIDNLENRVREKFDWKWGQNIPKWFTAMKHGQHDLFQPMCIDCSRKGKDNGN